MSERQTRTGRDAKRKPLTTKVSRLHADHPLVGTWVVAADSSSVEFKITAASRGFAVSAVDGSDGEQFVVTDVKWDGKTLGFNLLVPSNGTRAEHRIRLRGDGSLEDKFTAHYLDVLVRKRAGQPRE